MKCNDCDNLGWVSDEGEQVWGWCWYRRSCPDPDIDRDCPNFTLKRPSMLQQLKTENEKLRAELERVKAERDAAVADMTALMAGQCCDLCSVEYCNDRGKTEMCTAFKWSGIKKEDGK